MQDEASTELIEVFDRIIGANYEELTAHEVCEAYRTFMCINATREDVQVRAKIMTLLQARLANCLGE
jgi:hypothetical protein